MSRIRTLVRKHKWTEVLIDKLDNENEMQKMIDWCLVNFDASEFLYSNNTQAIRWPGSYRNYIKRFVFKRQQDAVAFTIKWL